MPNVTDVKAELLKRLYDYYYSKNSKDKNTATIEIVDVQFKFLSIDYDNLDDIKTTPTQIRKHRIDNPTEAEIESSFLESTESTDEFTWSVTEGLKLGAEATFKVTAPFIGESDVKASAELSLESTQEKKVTHTQKWEQQVVVKVPPRTSIEATTLLEQATIDTSFTITLIATGWLTIHRQGTTINGQPYDVTTGGPLERGWGAPGPSPTPWLPDENSRKFKAKGKFTGVNGLYISVTTKPLGK